MSNIQNAQPQVLPTDAANPAMNAQTEQNKALNDILAGSGIVNEFVKESPKLIRPRMNPFVVPGGGGKTSKNEYNVFYKNVSYSVKANSLLEAAQEGYNRMINNIPNFTMNKIRLSVQRKNKNRENHIYQFLVKKEKVKNPKHKYKITFQKL